MDTTRQFGGALGLAALVAVSEAHHHALDDVASGYSGAFLAIAAILVVVAVTALSLPGRAVIAPTGAFHRPRGRGRSTVR